MSDYQGYLTEPAENQKLLIIQTGLHVDFKLLKIITSIAYRCLEGVHEGKSIIIEYPIGKSQFIKTLFDILDLDISSDKLNELKGKTILADIIKDKKGNLKVANPRKVI